MEQEALGDGQPFEDQPALFDYLFGPEQPLEGPPTTTGDPDVAQGAA